MLKKCMIGILMISMLLIINLVVFADEETTEEYVYIINPEVGTSGKAIVNDTMFISIYVQSNNKLLLELIKNDTPVFNYEQVAKTLDTETTGIQVEEKISLFDVLSQNKQYSKDVIFKAYQTADLEKKKLFITLAEAKNKLSDMPFVISLSQLKFDDAYELTSAEQKLVDDVKALNKSYNQAVSEYNFWKNTYMKLFDKVIFKNVEIAVDPSFPYFEYTVNNIQPGHYKLRVTNEFGRVIERLDFEVVTEKNIASEILGNNNFFNNMINQEVFE